MDTLRGPRNGFLAVAVIAALAGCAKKDADQAKPPTVSEGSGALPPGHPPVMNSPGAGAMGAHPGMAGLDVATDGNAIPLKKTGLGSANELQRELKKLPNAAAAATFETAFRQTFTTEKALRDYATARTALAAFITANPKFAPAYRTLAYADFNLNPADPAASLAEYDKAVALDPEYGEAHYAIAFMCAATGERDKGIAHFRAAMKLGVQDERNIGPNFYSDMMQAH
jgi:tetratricopeptide (TPR) repeat protein